MHTLLCFNYLGDDQLLHFGHASLKASSVIDTTKLKNPDQDIAIEGISLFMDDQMMLEDIRLPGISLEQFAHVMANLQISPVDIRNRQMAAITHVRKQQEKQKEDQNADTDTK